MLLFSKNEDLIAENFDNAAIDVKELLSVVGAFNFHATFLQSGNQGCVVFKDFEQTINAGKLYQGNFARKD